MIKEIIILVIFVRQYVIFAVGAGSRKRSVCKIYAKFL